MINMRKHKSRLTRHNSLLWTIHRINDLLLPPHSTWSSATWDYVALVRRLQCSKHLDLLTTKIWRLTMHPKFSSWDTAGNACVLFSRQMHCVLFSSFGFFCAHNLAHMMFCEPWDVTPLNAINQTSPHTPIHVSKMHFLETATPYHVRPIYSDRA